MTTPTPTPTHYVQSWLDGKVPVTIVDRPDLATLDLIEVEAVRGKPFAHSRNSGERAIYPANHVFELDSAATVVLGTLLLDPEAPAEAVNAALAEWKASEPRFADDAEVSL